MYVGILFLLPSQTNVSLLRFTSKDVCVTTNRCAETCAHLRRLMKHKWEAACVRAAEVVRSAFAALWCVRRCGSPAFGKAGRERESMMFGCNASVAYKLLIRAHCLCGYTSVLLMKEWKIQLFRSDETRWITAHEVHWIGCAGESVSPKLYVCGGAFWMIPPYISVSASLEKVYIKLFVKLLH